MYSQYRNIYLDFTLACLQATFDISLTTTTGLTALSNMPVIATEDLSSGDTTTHFATSPAMSTYLVALIMGNLTSVSTMVPHPDPGQADRKVSIYGTPDRSDARLGALVFLEQRWFARCCDSGNRQLAYLS